MSITSIAYLLIYFSGIILALRGKPLIGLYTYLFAFYAYAPGRWWGQSLPSIRWALIAGLVTYFMILIGEKDSKEKNWFDRTEVKLFTALVIWVWIQNLWALSPVAHKEYSIMITKFLLLIFLIQKTIKDEKQLIGFILVNLIGCAYFGWIGLTEHQGGRFEKVGTPGMDDGNLLSLHMAPILIAGSYLLLGDYGKKKFLLIPLLALVVNAVLLTQSRGALIGLAAAAMLAWFFRPKNKRKLILIYGVLAISLGVSLIGEDFKERITQLTGAEETEEVDKSAFSRIVIIKAQWEMFKQSVVLGHGHAGTQMLSPQFIDDTYLTKSSGKRVRASHNLYMSLLVDFGLVGTVLYMSIIFVIFKRFYFARKEIIGYHYGNLTVIYVGLALALTAMLVSSFFSNSLRLEIDIWLIAALGVVHEFTRKKDGVNAPELVNDDSVNGNRT